MARLILALTLFLTFITSLPAQPPRLDRYGDPLPEGAVARIGSSRLRNADSINVLAYSPTGKRILSVTGYDGDLRIWEASSGKLIKHIDLNTAYPRQFVADAAFSDDKHVFVALTSFQSRIGQFKVLDVETGKQTRERTFEQSEGYYPLTFSKDAKFIFVGNMGKIRAFDVATDKEVGVVTTGFANPDIKVASNGNRLAASEYKGGKITVFDVRTGTMVREMILKAPRVSLPGLSPSGEHLLSVSYEDDETYNSVVTLWDLKTGKGKELFRDEGHVGCRFSPDGRTLATDAYQRGLSLWNIADGSERRLEPRIGQLTFTPDGKTLAGVGSGRAVLFVDVASGKTVPPSTDPAWSIQHLRFVKNGKELLGLFNEVTYWDPLTGKEISRLPSHYSKVRFAAFSADGSRIAFREPPHDFRVVHSTTGKDVVKLQYEKEYPYPGAISNDGKLLAGGGDKTVWVWDLATGKRIHDLKGIEGFIINMQFSPDSRTLAASSNYRTEFDFAIRLWDMASGKELKRFDPGQVPTHSLAFSPDGKLLAAGGGPERPRGNLFLWDIRSGKEKDIAANFDSRIERLAFSRDGRMLACGEYFGSIRILELASGKHRLLFHGHKGKIHDLTFSPDKHLLAAASPDGPVLVWDVVGSLEKAMLSKDGLDKAWLDLANENAETAFRAIRALVADPQQAVAMLRERLKPALKPDPDRVAQLIKVLLEGGFAERNKAGKELDKLADTNQAVLQKALEQADNLELKRRLEKVLARLEMGTPETLRAIRGVETLEWIATAEARALIEELANGGPEAVLTHEARKTLARLRKNVNQ